MVRLAVALIAVASVLSLSACKSKSPHASAAAAVARMQALKDRMCVCADAECARKVNDDLVQLTLEKSATFSQAEAKQMSDLGTRAVDCMARATRAKVEAGSGSA